MSRLAIGFVLMCNSVASAAPLQWRVEDGGNGHWYEVVRFPGWISWDQARSDAIARGGHLATLNSAAENTWVRDNVVATADRIAPDENGPYIGVTCEGRPWGTWYLVTGEPLEFTGWGGGEPNSGGNERYVHFWRWSGLWWNDITGTDNGISTYVLEAECLSTLLSISPAGNALLPGQMSSFTISPAPATATYQWLKDGVPVVDNERISGALSATLTILSVSPEDQGNYACRVDSACGVAVSPAAPLSCKPIILQSAPAATPQKRTLALTLGVPANAPYTYAWRRNGVPIANLAGVYSGAFTSTLRILSPDFIRGGTFDCVLTDVCGQTISASTRVCLADFNLDTSVDDTDFVTFARDYDTLLCSDPTMSAGCFADFNNDTVVDDADFLLFAAAYDELLCP